MTQVVPLTLEQRVERALLVLAYLVEVEGDVHLPMYEEFEAKLAEIRAKADVRQRARQRLTAFAAASKQSALGTSISIPATDLCRIAAS